MLGKYDRILLGVIGKVGNEGMFHVEASIIEKKTDKNWTWFLVTLCEPLYGEDDYEKIITLFSDQSDGLVNAIARVFSSWPHGYCL